MASVSSISGLSSLSEDLYYQYLINNNSTSTMLNALSGNTSDDSDSGLLGAVSSLYSSGLTGTAYGLNSLSGISSLLGGGSDGDLLTASQNLSSFSNILQVYLNAQTAEASQMADKLSGVLEEAAQTEDTSTLSYKTVQEIYQYFLEKTSASGANSTGTAQSVSTASQSQSVASAGIVSIPEEIDFDSLEQQLQQEAESVVPAVQFLT